MNSNSNSLDSVDVVADTLSSTASDDVQNMTRDDKRARETLQSSDLSDAIPGHSSATSGNNDSSDEKEVQGVTKEISVDDEENGDLGDAIVALHLTSSDDTLTDRMYKNEAVKASENVEFQGTPTNLRKSDGLDYSSSRFFAQETSSRGEARKLEKNKLAGPKVPSDIFVPLRPEGVFAEDDPNDTSPTSRVRFTHEATVRGYERGSRPSPTSSQPSSSQVLSHRASGFTLGNATRDLETIQAADVEDKQRLKECEEELDVLEETLPDKSQDPNSVKFTKLVIESARNAVKQAHEATREGCGSEEPMEFALYMTVRAHGFHEEALRLVNGQDRSSNIHDFERRIVFEDERREEMRSRNAGALPDDYFVDISDE